MTTPRKVFSTIAAVAALGTTLGLTACAGSGDPLADGAGTSSSSSSIIVGAADFAESQLIATIYSQALAGAGLDVTEKLSIGNREVYLTALEDGSIDLIPEYNGYLLQEIDPEANTSDRAGIADLLAETLPSTMVALDASEAENTNVLVVTPEFAAKHGDLASISGLAAADDGTFTLAGPSEWRTRAQTGIPGIADAYGIDFADRFQILDSGGPLSLAAVVNGQADVAMLFSSDPAIADNNLVALEDDQVIFPPANIMPLIRADKLDATVETTLNAVSEKLTLDDLMKMNGRINQGDDLPVIAEEWLASVGLA